MTYPIRVEGETVMAEGYVEGVYEDAEGVYLLLTVHKQGTKKPRRKLRRVRNLDNVIRL